MCWNQEVVMRQNEPCGIGLPRRLGSLAWGQLDFATRRDAVTRQRLEFKMKFLD